MPQEKTQRRHQELGERLIQEAMLGQLQAVRQLIADGADIDFANAKGFTPLMAAAHWKRLDVVRFLLENGADEKLVERETGMNALMYACLSGSREALELLLETSRGVNGTDCYGRTVLMMAVATGKVDAVKMLVKAGADINAQDALGNTALDLAVRGERQGVTSFLSSKGALRGSGKRVETLGGQGSCISSRGLTRDRW
jgi:uncharacterized protein